MSLPAASGWATPAVLCAVLALGLCVQAALPTAEPERAAIPTRPPRDAGLRLADAPTAAAADGAEALARPPFGPSRTSAEEVGASGAPGLLGVARVGGAALATVQDLGGATRTLRVGEEVQGWRLAAVSGDRAVMVRGGEARTLRVGDRPAPAISPSAAPAGASSGGLAPAVPSTPGGPT